MNKQAYEHVVGAVLNKQAYDWSKLLEDAKGVGQKAWEGIKDSYKKNPDLYHRGIIGALAGAGLGGAWKGWKGALAGAGIGGASAAGIPELYKYLRNRYYQNQALDYATRGAKSPEEIQQEATASLAAPDEQARASREVGSMKQLP